MKISSSILIASVIVGLASCDREQRAAMQDMNVQVSVDFSLSRGEDPQPFRKSLEAALGSAGFTYSWPEEQGSNGMIWILVADDNLTEAHQLFQQAMKTTGNQGRKSIVIQVLQSENPG
jgi:hypothetical protein